MSGMFYEQAMKRMHSNACPLDKKKCNIMLKSTGEHEPLNGKCRYGKLDYEEEENPPCGLIGYGPDVVQRRFRQDEDDRTDMGSMYPDSTRPEYRKRKPKTKPVKRKSKKK